MTRKLIAKFEIPGEPVSKARARFTKQGSKTFTYTPQKTLDGEKAVAAAYRISTTSRAIPDDEAFEVYAQFFCGTRQRRDVDNMLKLILDGLNKVAWKDDAQVLAVSGRKQWVAKAEAMTAVQVFSLGKIEEPTAPCVRCGTPFRTYESWVNDPKGKKYCSRECVTKHRVERRQRTCEQCGSGFLAWGESKETRFCSMACKSLAGRVELCCDHCASQFTKPNSLVRKSNYCSPECASEAAKVRRSTRMRGTCGTCGGGTTRKEYVRCLSCKKRGAA